MLIREGDINNLETKQKQNQKEMAEAGGDKIKLTIRQSSGDQFEVQIAPSATILELKQLCKEKTELPAESQRLIFKGSIAS